MKLRERIAGLIGKLPGVSGNQPDYAKEQFETVQNKEFELSVMRGLTSVYTYVHYGESGKWGMEPDDYNAMRPRLKSLVSGFRQAATKPGEDIEALLYDTRDSMLALIAEPSRRGLNLVALNRSLIFWDQELKKKRIPSIVVQYGEHRKKRIKAEIEEYRIQEENK